MKAGLLGRAGLALLGLAAALAVVEGAVRLAAPQAPAVPDQPGLNRGQFTVPGDHPVRTAEYDVVVHVNQQGFVDREWTPTPPEQQRVLLLGDSFVQAAQVPLEQGFGRVLEQQLRAAGRDVVVRSAGVPGAGTATALLLARQLAPAWQPDVVLYAFTTSNDVLNNHPDLDEKPDKPFFRLVDGKLEPVRPGQVQPPAWASGVLWEHSHALRWVGRTAWARTESRARIDKGAGLPAELRVHDPAADPTWEQAWAVTDALVGALSTEVQALGAAPGTLLVPDAVEITRQGRAAAAARWPVLADWDTAAARQRAADLAAAHGPVIDLGPALAAAEAEDPAPLYFPQDGHWTARGHAVAATAAAPAVLQLLDRADR